MSDDQERLSKNGGLSVSRRNLLATGASLGLAMAAGPVAAQSDAPNVAPASGKAPPVGIVKRRNIVMILLDDAGFADFGCFGGEIETPHIDRLATTGAKYVNYHTTGVCSATRACLMTGLNPHSAAMGWLADVDRNLPGYRGDLTLNSATLAELLRDNGYSTYLSGKWHLNFINSDRYTASKHNWPAQRGFDHSYWFHGHSSDYFYPATLHRGNDPIGLQGDPDYYLTDDLTSQAVSYVQSHLADGGDKPFFLYLAFNGPHFPLQARREDSDRYKGRYDRGWDVIRQERFERQLKLGLLPPTMKLPPAINDTPRWEGLSASDRKAFARYMEVYAGVVHRIDHNIGRIVDELERRNLLDDTLIVISSDNGASADGGASGTPNLFHGNMTPEKALALHDVLGDPETAACYPTGWTTASNTPFRFWKHTTYLGGISDPLIVHCPALIEKPAAVRSQYLHTIDIYPTVAALVGAKPLTRLNGRDMKPIEGLSFASSLTNPNAPASRKKQYYELRGHRAMYADGWYAVAMREQGRPTASDKWQLFDLRSDINETNDLASERPEILRMLQDMWHAEAKAHNVLPMNEKDIGETLLEERKTMPTRLAIQPPCQPVSVMSVPPILGRAHTVTVQVDRDATAGDGVLVAYGTQHLGFAITIEQGRAIYRLSIFPDEYVLRSERLMPRGDGTIMFRQKVEKSGLTSANLYINDKLVATRSFEAFIWAVPWQGLEVGANALGPVSKAFPRSFRYKGPIASVALQLDEPLA